MTDLKGHTESVPNAKWIEDKVISCSNDKSLKLWDSISGKCLNTEKMKVSCKIIKVNINLNNNEGELSESKKSVYDIFSLSKEEDQIFIYRIDKLHQFNYAKSISLDQKNKISDFDFIEEDKLIVLVSSTTGNIFYFCCESYNLLGSVDLNSTNYTSNYTVYVNNFTLSKAKMLTGGNDSLVTIWNTQTYTSEKILKKTDYCIKKAFFNSNCKYVFVSYEEPMFDIFDTISNESVYYHTRRSVFSAAAFHPIFDIVVFNGEDSKDLENIRDKEKFDDGQIILFCSNQIN